MLRLAILAFAGLCVCAVAGAQTPRKYDQMKGAVAVQRFPDGRVMASSAPFAVVERRARYMNAGNGSASVSVLIEAWPDKPVEISFMTSRSFPLMPTEVQGVGGNADPDNLIEAFIGSPWTQTTAIRLEDSVTCPSPSQWCSWVQHYRIDVSQDLVRDIVASNRWRRVSMGIGGAYANWTIPRDHLIATLDAIGLLHAFK